MNIAVTMPGKLGDAIYSLPTIKRISDIEGTKVDFYTSEYCYPLKRLFEYQSYINLFIIPYNYKILRDDMGIQPWLMPVSYSKYRSVYHLGYRSVPNKPLPNFIAEAVRLDDNLEIKYEYPDIYTLDEPYIVVSTIKKDRDVNFDPLFTELVEQSPYMVVVIGAAGEYFGKGIDLTGLDLLETTSWIAKSKGFVGLASAQLALANGFNIPKVVVHDGKGWDTRHFVRSEYNHYLFNPKINEVLDLL